MGWYQRRVHGRAQKNILQKRSWAAMKASACSLFMLIAFWMCRISVGKVPHAKGTCLEGTCPSSFIQFKSELGRVRDKQGSHEEDGEIDTATDHATFEEDGDETDTATDHATFEEFDETELTNEKNQPPIGHSVSPRERNTSMLLESGRYDNSDHHSDTGTRNELDESVSRSGWGGRRRRRRFPRRRRRLSKQAHTNNFYRIDKNYGEGEHYENCKDILYKPSGYGHMGGYTYAKVVFWEERDCKKK